MTDSRVENDLKAAIRNIPDYPKPGIMFRDITTLLGDARAFRRAVDELVQPWAGSKIDKVAGIEAPFFAVSKLSSIAHRWPSIATSVSIDVPAGHQVVKKARS